MIQAMLVVMFLADPVKFFGDGDAPKAVMTIVDSSGQPVTDEIDAGRMIVITTEDSVHDDVDGSLRWRIEGTSQVHVYPDKSAVVVTSELVDGLIRVQLIAAKGGRSDDQVVMIKVGHGPKPPPKPVDPPQPTVDPSVTGVRILITYESSAMLTREQLNILNSTQLVATMNEKCSKDSSGRSEWRKWDKSSIEKTGLKGESKVWQDLWSATLPKLGTQPQIVVVTDSSAVVHNLPATEAETVALVNKINVAK